jgi:hypothetical protein
VKAESAYQSVHRIDRAFDLHRLPRAIQSNSQCVPSDPPSLALTVDFSFLFSPRGGASESFCMADLALGALQSTRFAPLFPRQTCLARGPCSRVWLA